MLLERDGLPRSIAFVGCDDAPPIDERGNRGVAPGFLPRPLTSTTGPAAGRRGRLTTTAGISERGVDDEMFLIDGHGEAIYHLDATSAAPWRLLAEPMSRKAVVEALRQAFPDVPARRIRRDVGALLDDLTKRGLIGGGLKPRR